jgi:hypothetical protein
MKKLLLIVIAMFISSWSVMGQVGYVQYNSTGYMPDILPVEGGNFLALGYNNTTNAREIIKLDANMNVIWAKSYTNTEIIGYLNRSVALLKDGNYVVLGGNATNSGSAVVIKISPSGTVLFTKEYSFTGNFLTAFVIAAAAGNDNGFVFAGGACAKNNFLVKCDGNGVITWAKEFNDFTTTGVKSILTILPGATGYTIGAQELAVSGTDICMLQVSAAGNLLWYKQFKLDSSSEQPKQLIRLSNGGLVLLSTSSSTNSNDMLFFMDTTMSTVENTVYSMSGDSYINDIRDAGSNGIVCSGRYVISPSLSRMVYLKTDYSGSIVWQKSSKGMSIGGSSMLYSLAVSGSKIVLAGQQFLTGLGYYKHAAVIDGMGNGLCTDSTFGLQALPQGPVTVITKSVTPSNFTLNVNTLTYNPTTISATRTNLCGTVSVPESPEWTNDLFHPNPASDVVYLNESLTGDDLQIEIFSITGSRVYVSSQPTLSINISELPPSIYLLLIYKDGMVYDQKFVKQ